MVGAFASLVKSQGSKDDRARFNGMFCCPGCKLSRSAAATGAEYTRLIGCTIAAQVEGAKWVGDHPTFYVSRATCAPSGRFAKANC
jgi:hypothetical protein